MRSTLVMASSSCRAAGRTTLNALQWRSQHGIGSWLVRHGSTIPVVPESDVWAMPRPEHEVGSARLNWAGLGFEYLPTHGHVRYVWKDGRWDAGRFVREPFMSVHILSNVFHYGQSIFEGFKCFHTKDGSVSTFADSMSHARMAHGCRRFRMPSIPKGVWDGAVDQTIRNNASFVPPYGSGGALYLRPFIFGSGAKLGLGPSPEYTFVVFANPVGSYYKAGTMQALDCLVNDEYDRAAPLGCGDCKAAGNYAADLESMHAAKQKGYPISLYLDAKERKYVEEFNTSNFVAITKDGRYLTPDAPRSILASNTNKVLQQLAKDRGMVVEKRPIDFEAEVGNFAEVGAVGTAVVVTPLRSLTRGDRTWQFEGHKVLQQLHDDVRAVQQGEVEDRHGWLREVTLQQARALPMSSVYPGL